MKRKPKKGWAVVSTESPKGGSGQYYASYYPTKVRAKKAATQIRKGARTGTRVRVVGKKKALKGWFTF